MLFAQDKFSKGTVLKVLEIGSSDTYYKERTDFIGKDATAVSEITKKSNGFYSGSLEFKSGRTIYFTHIKVTKSDTKPDKKSGSKNTFSGSSIPKGTRFEIIEVPESDAYHDDRDEIEGKTGTLTDAKTIDKDGYVSGTIETDDGESYYFYQVKLGKTDTKEPKDKVKKTASSDIKFVTGTIKKGTSVYVADISTDDAYYSDRHKYIGKKGKVIKSDMTMKDDGYYAGDFEYEDGSTSYFYKAKFSKDPVPAVEASNDDSSYDDDMWSWLYDDDDTDSSSDADWEAAAVDATIQPGDRIEITAVSPEDSYYSDRADYVGVKGKAGDDVEYKEDEGGYSGTFYLDNEEDPFFYLIKAVKADGTSPKKSSSSSDSDKMKKGTSVVVMDVHPDDSYYKDKSKYVRKKGKVADSMTDQGDDYYSGKIIFDDGTNAYFYKVKLSIVK